MWAILDFLEIEEEWRKDGYGEMFKLRVRKLKKMP